LSNEFWYYILFPLGLFALHPRSSPRVRILSGVLFLLVAGSLWHSVLNEFPIWLTGTLLAVLPAPKLGRWVRVLATVAYVPLLFLLARQKVVALPGLTGDYVLTIATFFFLWSLLSATGEAKPSFSHRCGRELARFSYTLYVVHMPLFLLLAARTVGNRRWFPDLSHLALAGGIFLLVVAYAYGIAMLTEFHTDTWRRWIERQFRIGGQDASKVVTRA
jgi:peptidoglycan/LPS O-acetylase OafA/YrhL